MNPNAIQFIQELNSISDDNQLIAIACGVAIGRRLNLPNDHLEGKSEEFNNTLITTAREYVSKVNELKVLDTRLALNTARATYIVRFNALYPDTIIPSENECIWCDVFSISQAYKDIDDAVATNNKEAFVKLVSIITAIINTD